MYGILINLIAQFERIFLHNRQLSYQTRFRYREAMLRFLAFVASEFRLQKIKNLDAKHIFAYVAHLIESGRAIGYIKTELAAIRFWYDQTPMTKGRLPTNKELNLARRQYGKTDRTWSNWEFNRALALVSKLDREIYVAVLCLARYAGFRLHECFRMNTHDAELALKTGMLTIKGKGGLVREVPSHPSIDIQLRKLLKKTRRGRKLFVAADDMTHLAMLRFERFLYDHKEEIKDPDSKRPLAFHGLRHTYAVEKYRGFIAQGMSEKAARLAVSKLLGHGRDEVTKVYLASLDEEE